MQLQLPSNCTKNSRCPKAAIVHANQKYSFIKFVVIGAISIVVSLGLFYYFKKSWAEKADLEWSNVYVPPESIKKGKLIETYNEIRDIIRDGMSDREVLKLVNWMTTKKNGECWGESLQNFWRRRNGVRSAQRHPIPCSCQLQSKR
jgi:hypothetical protein